MSKLEQLPYPIYFVNGEVDKWHDLLTLEQLPTDLGSIYERCQDGIDVWSAQTYVHLKQQGLDVRFVSHPVPGQICVIPYHHLKIKQIPYNSYVIAIQYDCARPEICEQRVVLNQCIALDDTDHVMPHWHHPMLLPRDRARQNQVKTLDFKGGKVNLADPFLESSFLDQLDYLGITFRLSSTDPTQQFQDWGDYRQTDVVLAVRNATEADLCLKPAVKLINAWTAGCPAILGPEPAYQALRQSELDYLEVRSPEEAIAALQQLKAQPKRYEAMVENGLKRAQAFTTDQLSILWRDLLTERIIQGYEQWQQQSWLQKRVVRPAQFMLRVVRHKQAIASYQYNRDYGPRLFESATLNGTTTDLPNLVPVNYQPEYPF
jgi:hypothetical protein